jgi:hypothetical protein
MSYTINSNINVSKETQNDDILKKMKILMWMNSIMSMILILRRMIPITRKRTRITTRNEHSKSKVKSNY